MTPVVAPYRSGQQAGRDGFPQLLRAEWTKFRTVRGWAAGMVAAALMMVLFAVLAGISSDHHGTPTVPIGPGGEPVTDSFYFVHRPLAGNGSVTVSVSALTADSPTSGIVPWAKAGLIIKAEHPPGIAVCGDHGHQQPRRADAVRLHQATRPGIPGPVSAASAPLAAAGPLRRRGHRL